MGFQLQSREVRESPDCAYEGVRPTGEKLAPRILLQACRQARRERRKGSRQGHYVEPTCPQHQTGDLCEPEEGHTAGVGSGWEDLETKSQSTWEALFHVGACAQHYQIPRFFPEKPYALGFVDKAFKFIDIGSTGNLY